MVRAVACALGLLLLCTRSTAQSRASIVWYRAAEQCPTGRAFLDRLPARAPKTQLAEAGDHVDFVVTLDIAQDRQALGRLERQTQSGTVAIRELRDASCERVADALALSLALALEPTAVDDAPPASPPEASSSNAQAEAPAASAASEGAATQSAATQAAAAQPPAPIAPAPIEAPAALPPAEPGGMISDRKREVEPRSGERAPRQWLLGLSGGALSGLLPDPIPRGALFLERDASGLGLTRHLALRLAAFAALGSTATGVGSVSQWLAGARFEACPWQVGGARVALAPCLGFEVGATRASGAGSSGRATSGAWVAPGLELRGAWHVQERLRLELGAGALLPVVRNDAYAGSERLYGAAPVAFEGGLGLGWAM